MGPAPYPGTVTGPISPQSAAVDEISRAGRAYCHCPGSLPDLVLAEISSVFREREGRGHAVHPVLSQVPFLPRARLLTKSPAQGGVLPLPRFFAWPCFRRNHFRFQEERGGGTPYPGTVAAPASRRHFLLTELFRREKSRTFQDCCPAGFWPGMPEKGRKCRFFREKSKNHDEKELLSWQKFR